VAQLPVPHVGRIVGTTSAMKRSGSDASEVPDTL